MVGGADRQRTTASFAASARERVAARRGAVGEHDVLALTLHWGLCGPMLAATKV